VDSFLTEKFGGSSFVTAALLLYDRKGHEFRYVSLGHPPALLCPNEDPSVIALDGGERSGYLPWMTSRYFPPEAVEGRLSTLEPWVCRARHGETLVLYSDGVIEARDSRREEYGLRRLKEALQGTRGLSAQGVVKACLQDLEQFAGPAPQGDDITMVVVRAIQ
jgi:sigma-B regulation protein RsbU (phosphoserine phosphatase)